MGRLAKYTDNHILSVNWMLPYAMKPLQSRRGDRGSYEWVDEDQRRFRYLDVMMLRATTGNNASTNFLDFAMDQKKRINEYISAIQRGGIHEKRQEKRAKKQIEEHKKSSPNT